MPLLELVSLTQPEQQEMARVQAAIARREPFTLQLRAGRGGLAKAGAAAAPPLLQLSFRPATNDHLGEGMPLVGIPNFVEMAGRCATVHYFAVVQVGCLVLSCIALSIGPCKAPLVLFILRLPPCLHMLWAGCLAVAAWLSCCSCLVPIPQLM